MYFVRGLLLNLQLLKQISTVWDSLSFNRGWIEQRIVRESEDILMISEDFGFDMNF